MLTVLMVLDALVAIVLIAAVLGQEPKSAGMGGLDGGGDTVFSGKARGIDALLARITVVFAVLFAAITLVIAKMTM
ncbi:preprotein translocase subunit SecG [Schwartzia succinivorans DSM 10502]|uniref:Protein-export membrane protein SecG n=2 Tax=Schwartzia TaxID=55506 RepID=A0A1M4SZW5_9FIRM|nr:preprotein translocase subunit SecG [Schwartzia succinivorans]SHE37768.1 preprotein translocase subunit SecG [Schwartzia succinivorans DSM 10502]